MNEDPSASEPSSATIEKTDRYTFGNYARTPVAFVRGEGCRLWDDSGRRYLDLLSGLGVSSLGHGHRALAAAVSRQSETLLHTSNLYYHEPGALLAERLVSATFADRVFFCNSGAEANEAAIKLARRFGGSRYEIVSVAGSFHGRTLGALAATGQASIQEGFGPMPDGFLTVEAGDTGAVEVAVGERTAAVIIEPVLGEGGVHPLPTGYLSALRTICDRAGALLIVDEVQTGNGRTGRLYAHEHEDVRPDILTTAKGLAGGLPIGAVLATEEVAAAFGPGTHGSTFGANPVACRAALAVLDALDGGLIDHARKAGDHLLAGLRRIANDKLRVREARGRGLMAAIDLDEPAAPVVASLLEAGVVAGATADTVVRFLPPLPITTAELDEGLDILEKILR